jgi:ATP-dependent helicase/nuclease subunit A
LVGEAEVVALPLLPRNHESAAVPAVDDRAARLGQAVHRWLEWAAPSPSADRVALAQAAAAAFALPDEHEVLRIGSAILDSPECRPFFGADLRWAGSEVAVAGSDGQPRRIDRLVQRADGAWWVLDYKLAGRPDADPVLLAQLAGYRAAVQALVDAPVRAAFVIAGGALIEPA